MTRRPIFIGVTAILALVLTAGFAYGAGRLVGAQTPSSHSGSHHIGTTSVVPGSFSDHRGQGLQGPGYGSAFRSQMRGWIADWMRSHSGSTQSWAGAGYGRQGAQQGSGVTSGSYSNGCSSGCRDDHRTTTGSSVGPTSGSSGYGGYHHDDHGYGNDGDHDCW